MLPAILQSGLLEDFPDPRLADDEGLVAVGGDLSRQRLLRAYDQGVFPWFNEGAPELWWSPDPRAVIEPAGLHVSRRMARVLRAGRCRAGHFRITLNTAFAQVMYACAEEREDGTWILPSMIDAYTDLHTHGDAHSVEVWVVSADPGDSTGDRTGERLVGGVYGVQRGGLFAGESMFCRETNASKIALITLVRALAAAGVELIDVQMMTPHLASMGAVAISRTAYLDRIAALVKKDVRFDRL